MAGGMAGIQGDGLSKTGMGLFKALTTEIGEPEIAPDISHARIQGNAGLERDQGLLKLFQTVQADAVVVPGGR